MQYVAGRPLFHNGAPIAIGDVIPDAADWPNIELLLRKRWIVQAPANVGNVMPVPSAESVPVPARRPRKARVKR